MSIDEWYALGQRFRSLLQTGAEAGAARAAPTWRESRYSPYEQPDQADSAGVVGNFNRAARLRSGHILINLLARNSVFQMDPSTGQFEFLFSLSHQQAPFLWNVRADSDGMIYCTLSGMRDQQTPTKEAVFGMAGAGAVLRVDLRGAEVKAIATGEQLTDPSSIQFLDDVTLLVSDFAGFSGRGASYIGTGKIYLVDKITGELRILAESGMLMDPVSAYMDGAGDIWVANAFMHYEYGYRGQLLQKDDGQVIRIEAKTGRQFVVVDRQDPAAGSIIGIRPAHQEDTCVIIKGDWPMMETGAVCLLDKRTGRLNTLFSAAPDDPRFYSTHVDVQGSVLWFAECYRKVIIGYDLKKKKMVAEHDWGHLLGPWHGVASSFEGVESVSVVPSQDEPHA